MIEDAEVKMATAVRTLNENDQTQEMKNKQAKDLEDQLTAKRDECSEKAWGISATMCGLKTIRQEIYIMAGEQPFIQDCEVGDWTTGKT